MVKHFEKLKTRFAENAEVFKPLMFRFSNPHDVEKVNDLIEEGEILMINDDLENQLLELVKARNPSSSDHKNLVQNIIASLELEAYGVWVFYPWKKLLVHTLDEKEFIEVRTNRNRNKITVAEQEKLLTKTVAVIGLSVGNSVALTMAMERTCGRLILADFDTVELSNLNRIRAGIENLSLSKAVTAARQIAEIDPFLEIVVFNTAVTTENISVLLGHEANSVDLLVEVCDNLEVKVMSRIYARKMAIPVVMDTSDRGMIDVERFDLDNERPIFHGYVLEDELDVENFIIPATERLRVLRSIVDYEKLSGRMINSMVEIGKTISTWPQLASSVTLGGAATTDICRKILLNEHTSSGRYYVDLDQIFSG